MGHRLLAAIAPSVVVGAREVLQSSYLASIDILSEQVRWIPLVLQQRNADPAWMHGYSFETCTDLLIVIDRDQHV